MAFVDPTVIVPMTQQLEESVPAFQVFQESGRGNSDLGSFWIKFLLKVLNKKLKRIEFFP